jgi:hypothetical protein
MNRPRCEDLELTEHECASNTLELVQRKNLHWNIQRIDI